MGHFTSMNNNPGDGATIVLRATPKINLGETLNSTDIANSVEVRIDQQIFKMGWNERSYQVLAGPNHLSVGLSNFLFGKQAHTEMSLNLQPGEVIYLHYRMSGVTIFSKGILEVDHERMPAVAVATPSACRSCGAPLTANAAFCGHCGNRQTVAQQPSLYCAQCGNRPPDGKFCQRCGGALTLV